MGNDDDDERHLTSRCARHAASTHSVRTVPCCARVRQCNLTPPDKFGACSVETGPVTGKKGHSSVKSALVYKPSVTTVCHIVLTAVVITICNLHSQLTGRTLTLTKFLLQEERVGLYMDWLIHK